MRGLGLSELRRNMLGSGFPGPNAELFFLLSQLEDFKLFGFIYLVYLKKFELFLGLVIGEESLWFDNGICLGAAPSGPSGPSVCPPTAATASRFMVWCWPV